MRERITMVIGNLGGGGAERVCANLANAWVARGRSVTLLTFSSASVYALDPHVTVASIAGSPSLRSLAPVLRGLRHCPQLLMQAGAIAVLRDAILATAPDVVISHLTMTNLRAIAAMNETRIPVIACEHTDVTRVPIGVWTAERDTLYRRAFAVVATHDVCTSFLARRGARAVTIFNPLLPPSASSSTTAPRVVMLTRLSLEKRPGMAVRAFARTGLPWTLDLHGGGPLQEHTERLIAEWAPDRVTLHPFTPFPYDVLREASLFVSTSIVEGFGNAVWEALACGVPVVAMDCGAPIRSLVRDGVDGLLVRPDTTTALMHALALLMTDDARRAAYATRAPEVVTRFPFEGALACWEELLAA
ncbi:MAG: glycosyltransferase [Acidobacteria bacterium]|nr:glycosyltransferase [Acidobacteriota bacterium]